MNKLIVLSLGLIFLISSCTIDPCLTKGQFVRGYETMTSKVEKDYKGYTSKDWEKKDELMDKFIGECYEKHEEDLTSDEKKDIWINYFKYKFHRHGKNVLAAIEEDAKEFSLEIDEELEGLFDNPEEDVKRILSEIYGDDIDKAIDDFVKGIEDIAEKIKEWLEQK